MKKPAENLFSNVDSSFSSTLSYKEEGNIKNDDEEFQAGDAWLAFFKYPAQSFSLLRQKKIYQS